MSEEEPDCPSCGKKLEFIKVIQTENWAWTGDGKFGMITDSRTDRICPHCGGLVE